MEPMYFPSRAEWRSWLARHHGTETEARLLFYKKKTGIPTMSLDDAVREALCWGWIDGVMHGVDEHRYELRFTPRRARSRWSESNVTRARELIADGSMTEAGLRVIPPGLLDGGSTEGSWAPLMKQIPQDLIEALETDETARKFYESLPKSHKEMYSAWINEAKRPETRARRIEKAVGMLREGKQSR